MVRVRSVWRGVWLCPGSGCAVARVIVERAGGRERGNFRCCCS